MARRAAGAAIGCALPLLVIRLALRSAPRERRRTQAHAWFDALVDLAEVLEPPGTGGLA